MRAMEGKGAHPYRLGRRDARGSAYCRICDKELYRKQDLDQHRLIVHKRRGSFKRECPSALLPTDNPGAA